MTKRLCSFIDDIPQTGTRPAIYMKLITGLDEAVSVVVILSPYHLVSVVCF